MRHAASRLFTEQLLGKKRAREEPQNLGFPRQIRHLRKWMSDLLPIASPRGEEQDFCAV
jgi:hypothetical protein